MAEMRRLAITKEIYADIFDREEGSQLQVKLMEHCIVHDPHPEPQSHVRTKRIFKVIRKVQEEEAQAQSKEQEEKVAKVTCKSGGK
jgi:hypothetical protein